MKMKAWVVRLGSMFGVPIKHPNVFCKSSTLSGFQLLLNHL